MRLDHLLSKEHRDAERRHEPASIERIEGEAQGWNIDIDESLETLALVLPACRRGTFEGCRRIRHNTLLGPEGTGISVPSGLHLLEPPGRSSDQPGRRGPDEVTARTLRTA